MEIILLIVGIAVGGAIMYFFQLSRTGAELERSLQNNPIFNELKIQRDALQSDLRSERVDKEKLIGEISASKQSIYGLQEKLSLQTEEMMKLQEQFQKEFQNIANSILEKNSEKFSKQNKDQIDAILTPLRERIKDFEQKVDKTYDIEKGERIRLKKEIEDLVMLNKKLSEDAENLTSALKGDNKTQGNWGELILEKILERSGLREGEEFVVQQTSENSEGDKIRPDVVINLPDGKHLIIDSKVSLLAYSSLVGENNEEQRARYLKQHAESVRSHVKLLGDKNYHTAKDLRSPDFILLFMPIEAAFSAALQTDTDLFNFAWERRIVLVSPTTLLATLRTVDNIWKQEKRSKNADRIAEEAGKLYDKFVGFTTDLIEVGKKMGSAKDTYDEAMKKLSTGTGNLVSRIEKMRHFAAKAGNKSMNEKLVERALESDQETEGA